MAEPVWRVQIRRQAKNVLRRLPKTLLERIDAAIEALAKNPTGPDSRKLSGYTNLYRIRVGDWRITYALEKDVMVILIVEVSPRGDAYRNL